MQPEKITDSEKNWFIEPVEEWSQLFGGCNWYTVTPIRIEFEHDKTFGGVEATIIFLGIGFRWRWNYTETEQMCELKKRVGRLLDE